MLGTPTNMEDTKELKFIPTMADAAYLKNNVVIDKAFKTHRILFRQRSSENNGWHISFKTKKGPVAVSFKLIPELEDMAEDPSDGLDVEYIIRDVDRDSDYKLAGLNLRFLFRPFITWLDSHGILEDTAWKSDLTWKAAVSGGAPPKELAITEGTLVPHICDSLTKMLDSLEVSALPLKGRLQAFFGNLNIDDKKSPIATTKLTLKGRKLVISILIEVHIQWTYNQFGPIEHTLSKVGFYSMTEKSSWDVENCSKHMRLLMETGAECWKDCFGKEPDTAPVEFDVITEHSEFKANKMALAATGMTSILQRVNAQKKKVTIEKKEDKTLEELKKVKQQLAEVLAADPKSNAATYADAAKAAADKEKFIRDKMSQASEEEKDKLAMELKIARQEKDSARVLAKEAQEKEAIRISEIAALKKAKADADQAAALAKKIADTRERVLKIIHQSQIASSDGAKHLGITDINQIINTTTNEVMDWATNADKAGNSQIDSKILQEYEERFMRKAKAELGITRRKKKSTARRVLNTAAAVLWTPVSAILGLGYGIGSAFNFFIPEDEKTDDSFPRQCINAAVTGAICFVGAPALSVMGAWRGNDFETFGFFGKPNRRKPTTETKKETKQEDPKPKAKEEPKPEEAGAPPGKPWWKFW
ncbi:hypothetical protein [Morchella esculenta fusarivirus 2]|uniref:Uncharacterized protein n=1 Tax=Morchella esculenta fusarivirus 2 TaxID=2830907 RepID=A0AAE7RFV9_9VIRU|nr:hypothetical protein [Morchella esculenta fusarivirus 2]